MASNLHSAQILKSFLLLVLVCSSFFISGSDAAREERVVPSGNCLGFCAQFPYCDQDCKNHGYTGGKCYHAEPDVICCCDQ